MKLVTFSFLCDRHHRSAIVSPVAIAIPPPAIPAIFHFFSVDNWSDICLRVFWNFFVKELPPKPIFRHLFDICRVFDTLGARRTTSSLDPKRSAGWEETKRMAPFASVVPFVVLTSRTLKARRFESSTRALVALF